MTYLKSIRFLSFSLLLGFSCTVASSGLVEHQVWPSAIEQINIQVHADIQKIIKQGAVTHAEFEYQIKELSAIESYQCRDEVKLSLVRINSSRLRYTMICDLGYLVKRPVTVDVVLKSQALVTTRNLKRHQPLSLEWVTGEHKTVNLKSLPLAKKSKIHSSMASKSVRTGQILYENNIMPSYKVRKNDQIEVIAVGKGVRIASPAIALESGVVGERIAIRNTRSNKKLFAEIMENGNVKVNLLASRQ